MLLRGLTLCVPCGTGVSRGGIYAATQIRTHDDLGRRTGGGVVATPAGKQGRAPYSLDDWMTTSVGSFAWSPDGATIYFTSDARDSGTDEIFRTRSPSIPRW
jgi:hypothetical protein